MPNALREDRLIVVPCPTSEAATTGGVRRRHAFVVQDVHDSLGSGASDLKLEDADDDRGLLAIDHAVGADHAMVLVQDGLASIAISVAAGTQAAADLPVPYDTRLSPCRIRPQGRRVA
jgi:hypothetical protein